MKNKLGYIKYSSYLCRTLKMLNNGIFNGFEKLKIMTKIEQKIKEALLIRGFKNETILNNRGLIGAVIDETILATVKNTVG